jgi:hypothetical protein
MSMIRHYCFFFLTISLSFLVHSSDGKFPEKVSKELNSLKLWQSKEWNRIAFYDKGLWGTKGIVDGGSFYLATNGKTNPKAELIATVEGIYSKTPHSNKTPHPQCRFPARLSYLSKNLNLYGLKKIQCPELVRYKKLLKAESVSVVFSSYYMNNPGSTFGHTFLRFNKQRENSLKDNRRNELLDVAVSYGANLPEGGGMFTSLGGLMGFYRGIFVTMPYYFKVREYNDYENRDLWSYELNLSAEEVERLSSIFWELSLSYLDYYFFDENCAYIILLAIDAAAPRLNLVDRLLPWVIPADTIKAVSDYEGLVRSVRYRPSIRKQLAERLSKLDAKEMQQFEKLANDKGNTEVLKLIKPLVNTQSKVKVLDSLMDYITFNDPVGMTKKDGESIRWKQKVLLERASIQISSKSLDIPPPALERPDLGHDSMRLKILGGTSEGHDYITQAEIRFAIHDLVDPQLGFPKNSQVEFLNLKFRNTKERDIDIEDLTLVRIGSFSPQSFLQQDLSLRMETGMRKVYDQNCVFCNEGYFEMGKGISYQLGTAKLIGYGIAEFGVNYAKKLKKNPLRPGIGPRIGLIYHYSENLKFHTQNYYRYFPFSVFKNYYELMLEGRLKLSRKFALEFSAKYRDVHRAEYLTGIDFYF